MNLGLIGLFVVVAGCTLTDLPRQKGIKLLGRIIVGIGLIMVITYGFQRLCAMSN